MEYCTNCGKPIAPGMRFCGNCGADLGKLQWEALQQENTGTAESLLPEENNRKFEGESAVIEKEAKPIFGILSILFLVIAVFSISSENHGIGAFIAGVVLGLIFAIVALVRRERFKAFPIIALICDGIVLLIGAALIGAGIWAGSAVVNGVTEFVEEISESDDGSEAVTRTGAEKNKAKETGSEEMRLQTLEIGGIAVDIPEDYKKNSDEQGTKTYYDQKHDRAFILVGSEVKTNALENLSDQKLTDLFNEDAAEAEIIQTENRLVNGLKVRHIALRGDIEGTDCGVDLAVAVNDETSQGIVMAFVYKFSERSIVLNDVIKDSIASIRRSGETVSSTAPDKTSVKAVPSGVNPDLKEFLDSYEAFMDEYVVFMKNYSEHPENAMKLLGDYTRIMSTYMEFAQKAEQLDTDDMSSEDLAYYLEVMARIEGKLLMAIPN